MRRIAWSRKSAADHSFYDNLVVSYHCHNSSACTSIVYRNDSEHKNHFILLRIIYLHDCGGMNCILHRRYNSMETQKWNENENRLNVLLVCQKGLFSSAATQLYEMFLGNK